MGDWFGALPALAVSALLLFAPGAATGFVLGLRGLWLWATAPVISLAALAGGSILSPWMGLAWNLGTAMLSVLALCAALVVLVRFVLRAPFRHDSPSPLRSNRAWTAAALIPASVILCTATVIGVGAPDALSQTLDNLFHLGATRYIIETGNGSPFWVGTFASPGSTGFYPDLWHVCVALVSQLTGADLLVAINAFNLAVTVGVWPVGVLLLVRQFVPFSPAATVAAGALSAAFPAFPLNLLTYGVLYPLFLAVALLPLALSALVHTLGLSRDADIGRRSSVAVISFIAAAAIGFSHPSAFMTLLAFSVPIVLVAYLTSWRSLGTGGRLLSTALLLAYLGAGVMLLLRVRTAFQWPAQTDLETVIGQTVTGNYLGAGFGFVIGALALTGACVAITRRDASGIAATGTWLVGAALYASAAGIEHPLFRRLVSAWYADTPRLGAVAVISVIPVAVLGFAWTCERLLRLPRAGRSVSAAVGAAALLAILATAGYPKFLQQMRMSYDYDSAEYIDEVPPIERSLLGNRAPDGSRVEMNNVLSPDERRLLERLPQHVPEDAVIVGNPWTGATLAYAFEARQVIPPYLTTGFTAAQAVIMQEFAFSPDDPRVCEALEETGVRFVLDFGEREVHSGDNSYPGIEHLDGNPAAELVDQQGEAKLFRITSCGLGG